MTPKGTSISVELKGAVRERSWHEFPWVSVLSLPSETEAFVHELHKMEDPTVFVKLFWQSRLQLDLHLKHILWLKTTFYRKHSIGNSYQNNSRLWFPVHTVCLKICYSWTGPGNVTLDPHIPIQVHKYNMFWLNRFLVRLWLWFMWLIWIGEYTYCTLLHIK